MNELSPEARAIIEAGRNDIPTAATKAAIKGKVLAQVAAPAAAAAGAKAAGFGAGAKGLGVVLGLGLVAGALYVKGGQPEAPEPPATPVVVQAPSPEPAPSAPAATPEAPVLAAEAIPHPAEREVRDTAPVHQMRAKARVTPAPKAPAPAVEATDVLRLAQEARLLKAIRVALRDGDHDRVLELTARHADEFPEGALVTERLAARARALCAKGDLEAGRAVRAALAARAPTAPALARVDEACGE